MAIECTDPDRWGDVPGLDANEATIALYLAHLDECEYHAKLEGDADARIAAAMEASRGRAKGRAVTFPGVTAERMRRRHDELESLRRQADVYAISVRVEGVEKARVSLEEPVCVPVEAPDGALVSIWGVGSSPDEPDLFLASAVISRAGHDEPLVVPLRHQTLAVRIERRADAPAKVSIVHDAEPSRRAAGLGRLGGAIPERGLRWAPLYGLVAAGLAIAVVAPLYFLAGGNLPVETSLREAHETGIAASNSATDATKHFVDPKPDTDPAPQPLPQPTLHQPARPHRQKFAPAESTTVEARVSIPEMKLADVKKVRIVDKVGAPKLVEALAASLTKQGGYTVVSEESESDSTLTLAPTRGPTIAVALTASQTKSEIWQTHIKTDSDAPPAAAAERLVQELLDETKKEQSETPPPSALTEKQ